MARRSYVIERDRGWRAIEARMRQTKGAHVKVGVTSGVGLQSKQPGKGQTKPTGLTLVEVAWFNEFGTKTKKGKTHVPERSFIRSTHDENRLKIRAKKGTLLRRIQDGLSVRRALEILGVWMKGKIQKKINDLRVPPNAPSTKKRKGSSNPLVDIGQLKQGIDYEVFTRAAAKGSVR